MNKVFISALFFFISNSAFAQKEEQLETFLKYQLNPSDTKVSSELRRLGKSVASLGAGEGQFSFKLKEEFLTKSIYNESTGKYHSFKDVFEEYITPSSWSIDGEKYYSVFRKNDFILNSLIEFGVIEGGPQWRLQENKLYDYYKSIDMPNESLRKSLAFDGRETPGQGYCTGFLVGESYFLTNHHCISSQAKCDITAFRFNEEIDPVTNKVKDLDSYQCSRILLKDSTLDFALVEVEGRPGEKYKPLRLTTKQPRILPTSAKQLSIIGHPGNHPDYNLGDEFRDIKKVIPNCHVNAETGTGEIIKDIDRPKAIFIDLESLFNDSKLEKNEFYSTRFGMNCPVVGGNSGSPIFDYDGYVIGIAKAGSDWITNGINYSFSKGVSIKSIFDKYKDEFEGYGIYAYENQSLKKIKELFDVKDMKGLGAFEQSHIFWDAYRVLDEKQKELIKNKIETVSFKPSGFFSSRGIKTKCKSEKCHLVIRYTEDEKFMNYMTNKEVYEALMKL